jgi:acyl-homoserine lactone acylase PvdQ
VSYLGNTAGARRTVAFHRSAQGVPLAEAASWADALYGLGWLHGRDRGAQVCLARIAAQRRLCELLRDEAETLVADLYFRRLALARDARERIQRLPSASLALLDADCQGSTDALQAHRPWPLRLAGDQPEPFLPSDERKAEKILAEGRLPCSRCASI